jgi:hypothetical protein
MHTDRETTRIVQSWLDEGVTALPDRVLDAVLDQVPATRQRRSWWPAWRFEDMNSIAKFAIAAAAVVVVAVVGVNLLPRSGGDLGGAPPSAWPSSSPTPSGTPAPSILPLGIGPVTPGTYALYWDGPRISFQVPDGWTSEYGVEILKQPDTLTALGWGGWLGDPGVTHVYGDACKSEGTLQPIDGTVAGLVAALDAQVSTDATITDVMIDGRPAKRVDLVESPGVDRADCRNGADGPLQIWAYPAEDNFYALAPRTSGFVHALDIDGRLAVFHGIITGDPSEADIAELNAILASIEIADATPTASP